MPEKKYDRKTNQNPLNTRVGFSIEDIQILTRIAKFLKIRLSAVQQSDG